ncbi:MAG: Acetate operon repressor [Verrucomicrobiota bacterium]|jgi:DNA-binding IclR family transcriptional regulator
MGKARSETSAGEDFSVPSLERGMAILELVGSRPEGMGLAQISEALEISLNSVFRIASALEQLGYLRRDEAKKFFLAGKTLKLGLKAAYGRRDLVECCREPLVALRDEVKESVALAVLLRDEGRGIILHSVESLHSFSFKLRVGHLFELYCSGPGKAILAGLPDAEYELQAGRCGFAVLTPSTLSSRSALDKEMAAIRKAGYALDRAEAVPGCHCVAAAITDDSGSAVAAIWTSGPSDRLTKALFPQFGAKVAACAQLISRRLQNLE